MTIENDLYGPKYKQCGLCGVKQRPDRLFQPVQPPTVEAGWYCVDTRQCLEWKALLQQATPADITAAAQSICNLVRPGPEQLFAEVYVDPDPNGPVVKRKRASK